MQTRSQKNGQAEQRDIRGEAEKLACMIQRRREVIGYGSFVPHLLYQRS